MTFTAGGRVLDAVYIQTLCSAIVGVHHVLDRYRHAAGRLQARPCLAVFRRVQQPYLVVGDILAQYKVLVGIIATH